MYQNTEPARYWQQQLVEWGPKVLFAILILVITHFVAKAVQWGDCQADRPDAGPEAPSGRRRRQHRHRARAACLLAGMAGRPDRGAPAARPVGRADSGHRADQRSVRLPAAAARRRPVLLRRPDPGADRSAMSSRRPWARSTSSGWLGRAGLSIGEPPVAVDSEGTASEGAAPARSSIARAVGVTVSAMIIIFAAIGALHILQVAAISEPATNMLNMIALAIPNVLAALVWLAIAFIIGQMGQEPDRNGPAQPRLRQFRPRAGSHAAHGLVRRGWSARSP